MLTHFQYKPLYKNTDIPGWEFSFFYKKLKRTGRYLQDGKIEWQLHIPDDSEKADVESKVHELMLFHVYDR
ncbi:YheE family protein [Bacillus sp. FJAT-27445]|uniref:YheE family protein n=1 Tax=Bacillus sp. FJAT-27445 TaxID=1679166 RepID=UPI0007443151|nr:YheE family protein [Bacillus sp. FJAT-27445]